jgi:hypothetical protein
LQIAAFGQQAVQRALFGSQINGLGARDNIGNFIQTHLRFWRRLAFGDAGGAIDPDTAFDEDLFNGIAALQVALRLGDQAFDHAQIAGFTGDALFLWGAAGDKGKQQGKGKGQTHGNLHLRAGYSGFALPPNGVFAKVRAMDDDRNAG